MDEVGLRELARVGSELVRDGYASVAGEVDHGEPWPLDADVERLLDRIALLLVTCMDLGALTLFPDLLSALVTAFRMPIPQEPTYGRLPRFEATYLTSVTRRVFALGAVAVRRSHYPTTLQLVFQSPEPDNRPDYYWIRYAITMAARVDEFRPLVGPSSEWVRDHPEFFGLFGQNMDEVTNAMCEFDFYHCVAVIYRTGSLDRCYPSFGAYWKYRTTRIVRELVRGGPARDALEGLTDERLAEIIRALDELAAEEFFRVAAWDRGPWGDPVVDAFLHS